MKYNEKQFKSVSGSDLDLDADKKDSEKDDNADKKLLESMKEALGDKGEGCEAVKTPQVAPRLPDQRGRRIYRDGEDPQKHAQQSGHIGTEDS